ncbi:cystathionine gamma-synthase [Sporobacter termitidis DSM 10068]|uniref:Cystathionine gamma-synthase n=1 Tax=Sporobacter termitidis DSM 10068 TaxID=1123282 RepID=A0A1M5Z1H1_9FIRM|nr:PLP-dependent aspartate aminotransferase family protein [Sporobacter termitidis]SHI18087.1 cystathionine gamma-synthase [Sporobacter termitidis DSM 10068]
MDIQTKCIHGDGAAYDTTGAVSVPIYQSATFAHPGVGRSTGFDYTRVQNPTREHLEKTVAGLENGVDAMAFASGMAAIGTLLELFSPGDRIVASDDLYGGTHRYFYGISVKNGLSFDLVNTSNLDEIRAALTPETKAVFVETPTNPMMQVSDIAAIAGICREKGLLLIVDNTFLTPYFQRPIDLGADIIVHSGTKYLGGHNDTLAGFLVAGGKEVAERLRYIYKTVGPCLAPFDSWLILRGIKTLAIRMEKQQETALLIAQWLTKQKKIKAVHYVGLPSHPHYEISKRQASGFGAMISFEAADAPTAVRLLERVRLIRYAESLGGVESLITYPLLQTHADVPEEQRLKIGITDRLLRLSVGLESAGDLISDLSAALGE